MGTYRAGGNNAFGTGTLSLDNNLVFTSNDTNARTFANTQVNIGGNVTFGQTTTVAGTLTFNGTSAVFRPPAR